MADKDIAVPSLNEAQLNIINGKTPVKYVKQRPGRGGKNFDYVEVGYVVDQLNKAFKLAWDWEITDQQVGKGQVWVKGVLKVYFGPDFFITKSAFGGAEIKRDRETKQIIDIADDLKAASADALKKAASLIGVASDIYYPQLDRIEDNGSETGKSESAGDPRPGTGGYPATEPQVRMIFKLASEKTEKEPEEFKEEVKQMFSLASFNDLTKFQASKVIEDLLGRRTITKQEEEEVNPDDIPF